MESARLARQFAGLFPDTPDLNVLMGNKTTKPIADIAGGSIGVNAIHLIDPNPLHRLHNIPDALDDFPIDSR